MFDNKNHWHMAIVVVKTLRVCSGVVLQYTPPRQEGCPGWGGGVGGETVRTYTAVLCACLCVCVCVCVCISLTLSKMKLYVHSKPSLCTAHTPVISNLIATIGLLTYTDFWCRIHLRFVQLILDWVLQVKYYKFAILNVILKVCSVLANYKKIWNLQIMIWNSNCEANCWNGKNILWWNKKLF